MKLSYLIYRFVNHIGPVNPFMPVALKIARQLWWYLSYKSNFDKIFEGEMLTRNQLTIPLEIFF